LAKTDRPMSTPPPDVVSVFADALEHSSSSERVAFLDRVCADQPGLREQVEELLRAHDAAGQFLAPEATPEVDETRLFAADARPGQVIAGRYTLREEIAQGGMGTVWVADQTTPVRRRVAIKLIKAGMDTRQVLSRFDAERQALALMDHPNIAKVFDGGMTEEGRPFFAMEYVKGVPITEFCDDARLSLRERLQLFIPVCQAVQHAHQKGIIHRDLKPSNILVCPYDGKPVPKVIDFGLAKAMHQPLTEQTLYTAHGMMVGTPLYMSPEQAEFNNYDIDTRTDVYSLGVILYELLIGSTPLDRQQFKNAAWQEIVRLIREQEPSKPSTKLSSSKTLPSIAAQRQLEPAQLGRLVRGDLDWIVMKALEKERGRRYPTAIGLASDVERYLNHVPVEASPPSAAYRFRKFARRNRGTLLVASTISLATIVAVVALGLSNLMIRRESQLKADALIEKNSALKAAQVSESTAQLRAEEAQFARQQAEENLNIALSAVEQMLTRVADERLVVVPQMETVRRDLLQDAVTLYESLLSRTRSHEALRLETSKALHRLGGIRQQQGEYDTAEETLIKAIEMCQEMIDDDVYAMEARSLLIDCEHQRFWMFSNLGKQTLRRESIEHAYLVASESMAKYSGDDRFADQFAKNAGLYAEVIADESPQLAEQILRRCTLTARTPDARAMSHSSLGRLLLSAHQYTDAEQAFRAAIDFQSQAVQLHDDPYARHSLISFRQNLADAVDAVGRTLEAESICSETVRLIETCAAEFPGNPAFHTTADWVRRRHGEVLEKLGRVDEAERTFRTNATIQKKLSSGLLASMPASVEFLPLLKLAEFLNRRGRSEESSQVGREALNNWKMRRNGLFTPSDAGYLSDLASLLMDHGCLSEAANLCREVSTRLEAFADDDSDYMQNLRRRVEQRGQLAEALSEVRSTQGGNEDIDARAATWSTVIELTDDNSTWNSPRRRLARELASTPDLFARTAQLIPNQGALWIGRGQHHALRGRWKDAAADYAKAFRCLPLTDESVFEYAGVLLLSGETAAYRELCTTLVSRCDSMHTRFVSFITARSAGLGPMNGVDPERLVELAREFVEELDRPWTWHVLGLSQYRAGQIDLAMKSLERSVSGEWGTAGKAQNRLVMAMACHQRGEVEEARGWLQRAQQAIADVRPANPDDPAGVPVPDWIELECLSREATSLLGN
jgi:eukaryotic-like serine/threonine-protein kinase